MPTNSNHDLDRLVATLLYARRTSDAERRDRLLDAAIDQLRSYGRPTSQIDTLASPGREPWSDDSRDEERDRTLLHETEQLAEAGGWQWDARTDDVHWTPGTYELFGMSRDTDLDLEVALSKVHPDDRTQLERVMGHCLETGVSYELELRIRTADNHTRWVRVHGEVLETDGDPVGLVGAIVDVTTSKEREQRLQVLNRILRHNLRNDLNVILGRAQLLSEELAALDVPEALTDMDEVGGFLRELDRLVQDADSLQEEIEIVQEGMTLLASFSIEDAQTNAEIILEKSNSLSRLVTKARKLDAVLAGLERTVREPVAIRPVLEAVRVEFETRFPEATIDVECADGVRVLGIEAPLKRAITELVENALIHGGPEDVRVTITVGEGDDGTVEIRVADDGPGVPAMERETLDREMETPLLHGQGVGLWLVTWVVRQLHGRLAFHDREPEGSVACIELPRPRRDD